jgi:hypothetical protein
MVEKEKPQRPTAEEYNALVNSAELMDIKLIKSDFDVQPIFFSTEDDKKSYRYDCELARSFHREGGDYIFAEVALEAGCKVGRKWLLRSKSTYLVAYALDRPTSEAAALEYLKKVARFTAFPYFRAHFAEQCSQAGAVVQPLPVLKGNIPKKVDRETDKALTAD